MPYISINLLLSFDIKDHEAAFTNMLSIFRDISMKKLPIFFITEINGLTKFYKNQNTLSDGDGLQAYVFVYKLSS